MSIFTPDLLILSKSRLPLPDKETIIDSILSTNPKGFNLYNSNRFGHVVVECENRPRDLEIYGWIWKKL